MISDKTQINAAGFNNLKHEKSPYLIQHARQPVDWYPWGRKAFEQAASSDKPVLVSIGYSTCHWCHVMARESFEDSRIAALMNRLLVCIKVDREERPDIDAFLISAVQAFTGSAGWPLNVFLTPEGRPFYGGTYFPPHPRHGMPSWPDVVNQISEAWKDPDQKQKIKIAADSITRKLGEELSRPVAVAEAEGIRPGSIREAVQAFAGDFDSKNGGFGRAPKFPMPSILAFLSSYYRFAGESRSYDPLRQEVIQMIAKTLDAMAKGGIYDHIGGGFHRYATDQSWFVPHFEKMLYDNAQLIRVYADAFELTGTQAYRKVARETIDYLLRDMRHPEGGFFSAEDADSLPPEVLQKADGHGEKREGAFYVWRLSEIERILAGHPDEQAEAVFSFVYGVRKNGNVGHDPFDEFKQQNVLHQAQSIESAAARFNRPQEKVADILDTARQMLFQSRLERHRPHLDDKVLTGWNGLIISGLARAHRVFNVPDDLAAAVQTAGFLYRRLYDEDSKVLYRRWREGEARIDGMAEDYAFLIQGLLDLYEAGADAWFLQWANELTERFLDGFLDHASGNVYMSPQAHDPYLAVKMNDATDNVTPAAASVAALNLVRLSRITGRRDFETAAESIFRSAGEKLNRFPKMAPYLLKALMLFQSGSDPYQ